MKKPSAEWVCCVPVATVWHSPGKARDIDAAGIAENASINNWIEAMNAGQARDLMESGRIETQLLYGEPVAVDEIVAGWAKIAALRQPSRKDERGYPGWVPLGQLKEVERVHDGPYARVISKHAQLWTDDFKPLQTIPFNAMLPVIADGEYVQVLTPDEDAWIASNQVEMVPHLNAMPTGTGKDIASLAEEFLNLHYFWGGMSSYGYDCSGLTFNVLRAIGIQISRDAGDQALEGAAVDKASQANWEVGDLLFFANDNGRAAVRHVGIYYGNGLMIHSPTAGKAIEIIPLAGSKYADELCAVRRFVESPH